MENLRKKMLRNQKYLVLVCFLYFFCFIDRTSRITGMFLRKKRLFSVQKLLFSCCFGVSLLFDNSSNYVIQMSRNLGWRWREALSTSIQKWTCLSRLLWCPMEAVSWFHLLIHSYSNFIFKLFVSVTRSWDKSSQDGKQLGWMKVGVIQVWKLSLWFDLFIIFDRNYFVGSNVALFRWMFHLWKL